jgi:hypothetical protein
MGESYCNDGRCKWTRRGEKHPAHNGVPFKTEDPDMYNQIENPVNVESNCNDSRCKWTRRGEKHPAHNGVPSKMAPQGYLEYCDVKYLGGHKAYPRPTDTRMSFYDDRIELGNPNLVIPYSAMKKLENFDEKKILEKMVIALRLVGLPLAIVDAMWKKNHIYTVIQYQDEMDDHAVVVDFEKYPDEAQPLIYHKMLELRKIAGN